VPEHQGLEQKKEEAKPEEVRVVAIDPGIRTFATCYDPSGAITEWGHSDIGRIYQLCRAYDKLQSRWTSKEVNSHKRWSMWRAGSRIHDKICSLVADLHHKFAKWLCESFSVVLLPKFETQQMIRRGQRKIRNKTARAMVTWSHYRFRMRLQDKAREYLGCKVLLVDEAYTSKTCGRCGKIHSTLGEIRNIKVKNA